MISICLEGIDGVGKTTIINTLVKQNPKKRIKVIKEPAQPFKELTKQYPQNIFLFLAARYESFKNLDYTLDYLLIDRYSPSMFVYSTEFTWEELFVLDGYARKGFIPNYTYHIDVDPEICLERLTKRGEYDTLSNLKNLRDKYYKFINLYGEFYNFVQNADLKQEFEKLGLKYEPMEF